MTTTLGERVAGALGKGVRRAAALGGGAGGSVTLVELENGEKVVAKVMVEAAGEGLRIESRMLALLAERSELPVPRVLHAEPDLLVMEHRRGSSSFNERAERHAAELLSALHGVPSADGRYGLEYDALIGPLPQPNGVSASWVEFWRERRVLHMKEEAQREGRIGMLLARRLERLASRLGELVPESPPAVLIHGDVWAGNVLAEDGRVTAFLDPSPYHAHHEVELAFITLFGTFGEAFWSRYAEVGGPVEPAFREVRRHVYNVYPLLVHVRIFGGAYVGQLESTLSMLGF
jgi:fructosamine-3-kinase